MPVYTNDCRDTASGQPRHKSRQKNRKGKRVQRSGNEDRTTEGERAFPADELSCSPGALDGQSSVQSDGVGHSGPRRRINGRDGSRKNTNHIERIRKNHVPVNAPKPPLNEESQEQVWTAPSYETSDHEKLHKGRPSSPSTRGKSGRGMAPKGRRMVSCLVNAAEDAEVGGRTLDPEYSQEGNPISKERRSMVRERSMSKEANVFGEKPQKGRPLPLNNERSRGAVRKMLWSSESFPSTKINSGEEPLSEGASQQSHSGRSGVYWSSVSSGGAHTLYSTTLQLTQPEIPGPGMELGRQDERQSRRYTERLQRVGLCNRTDPAAQERIKVRVMYKRLNKGNATMYNSSAKPRSDH